MSMCHLYRGDRLKSASWNLTSNPLSSFLQFDEAIASAAVIVIVSGSDKQTDGGRTETLPEPAK